MIKRVLIIGGYGNFGTFITKKLALENNIQVIVAGRSVDKANKLIADIEAANKPEAVFIDINVGFEEVLGNINPDIVIHTSGPFQSQGYDIAQACIAQRCHYIDLADGREFVAGITSLDAKAKQNDVLVISGASSVPCLTSALVDYYRGEFRALDRLDYGITTAQKTARGLATTAAILSYTGKPIPTLVDGEMTEIYGWQDMRTRHYSNLGRRILGNCDVPDLALFPNRYPDLKNIRFYAGLEIPLVHVSLWGLSWLVRAGLFKHLEKLAPLLLKISYLFDWFGSSNSGFHMELSGKGFNGEDKIVTFELTARSGDGPYIPCMPAILLAKKLSNDTLNETGAFPCMGFIGRDEYLDALKDMDITWTVR